MRSYKLLLLAQRYNPAEYWPQLQLATSTAVVDTVKQRKPAFASINSSPSGRVSRDDRGSAVWQWDGNREEMHANLDHLGLTVGDDPQQTDTKSNSQPAGSAGNPYNSDLVQRSQRGTRQDLRALSRQIEQQRKRTKDEKP